MCQLSKIQLSNFQITRWKMEPQEQCGNPAYPLGVSSP
nr:MAG TPA: hypothetical protein [Caudoviricetes sp.]